MSTAVAERLAEQADRLLDLWSRLALQHVALGSACACGAGGVSLRLEDFELDVVDYLEDAGTRSGLPAVEHWCRARQAAQGPARRLDQLLADLQQDELPADAAAWLLQRLERTLRSFAELHSGGGL